MSEDLVEPSQADIAQGKQPPAAPLPPGYFTGECIRECYLGPLNGYVFLNQKMEIDPHRPEAIHFHFEDSEAEKIKEETKRKLQAERDRKTGRRSQEERQSVVRQTRAGVQPYLDSIRISPQTAYDEQTRSLAEGQVKDDQRRAEILGSVNPEMDEARKTVLAYELAKAIAAGDQAGIAERRAGLEALEASIRQAAAEREQELADLTSRDQNRQAEAQRIAKTIFEDAIFSAGQHTRTLLSLACDLMTHYTSTLAIFNQEHSTGVSLLSIRQRVLVGHTGQDRGLRERLTDLLG